mmetsp:Transcript_8574/g.20964  ORF Transcript_8574/g.20964 Transcript_8574/m.20964 type:complete len:304 (+) Transcript_8574:689-1600(+)
MKSSTASWYVRESYHCERGEVDVTGPNPHSCGVEWYYPFDENEHESGEDHPFANEGNRYCLDCGMAVQVCASDESDDCANLGLSERIERSNETTNINSGRTSASHHLITHRDAWVAHGVLGAVAFGMLVPSAMISTDVMRSTYWIYHAHVGINILTFTLTFVAVGLAVVTMNGIVSEGAESHMSELHHLIGLLLLLLVSIRSAIGFQQLEFGFNTIGMIFIFLLGSYQVRSGLGLFAKRYGTADLGQLYLYCYVALLAVSMLGAKCWMKWKEQKMRSMLSENTGMQMPDARPELTEIVGLTKV